ncbi:unnamed protein product [Boreogadus saida]
MAVRSYFSDHWTDGLRSSTSQLNVHGSCRAATSQPLTNQTDAVSRGKKTLLLLSVSISSAKRQVRGYRILLPDPNDGSLYPLVAYL